MDIFILVGGFTIVCLMGMPVAYALGIAAIAAALYAGIPLEAVMLKVAGGMSGFSLLAIPSSVYSVVSWLTVSGSGSEKNFCVMKRSITNKTVSAPPIGIGK